MNLSGPDVAAIQCRVPDGCCAVSPCAITEVDFICQIRSLLPEGDLYNNTLPPALPPAQIQVIGTATVGCSKVGCEQMIFGGCCDQPMQCDYLPVAPQLAVVDSFSAIAYQAIAALCRMLRELDPCSADITIRKWAARFGITYPDPCGGTWSDAVLAVLICEMAKIRLQVINWDYLTQLAARFGAAFVIRNAGDLNCGPIGWWTMARAQADCPPGYQCPADADVPNSGYIRLTPTCIEEPDSLNLILSPTDITLPPNCNNPPNPATLPHDPELYEAFKWLLPKILPQPIYWCVYERDEANCIV